MHLLPNLLDERADPAFFFPEKLKEVVSKLDFLIAEEEKEGRRYLLRFMSREALPPIFLLNEHTREEEIEALAVKVRESPASGLVSDAGLCCLADPGSALIAKVQGDVEIIAWPGPSSIIMAIQKSGLFAQNFFFHGYPPKEELGAAISRLERGVLHIYIEAPYRSDQFLSKLLSLLPPDASLAIAKGLTCPDEFCLTKRVAEWKKNIPTLGKAPTVFLFAKK